MMAQGEIAHRAYRIIPLAGCGCRIAAHRSACFDLAPVPPPARLLVRWDDPEACRPIVDALWAGDPEPVRSWLPWNDPEVAAWVKTCDEVNLQKTRNTTESEFTIFQRKLKDNSMLILRCELAKNGRNMLIYAQLEQAGRVIGEEVICEI